MCCTNRDRRYLELLDGLGATKPPNYTAKGFLYAAGALKAAAKAAHCKPLCPTGLGIDAAGIGNTGLLFRAVLKGNRLGDALHPAEVSRVFKHMASVDGFSPDEVSRISAHSSRLVADP